MITNTNTAAHYTWGQNCDSWVLAETAGLSVKQEHMPPGAKEQLHFHKNVQQYFYILKGTATFYCNDKKETAKAGSGILINAGTKHFIANESKTAIEFLVISQPNVGNDRINL
ncbi:MAG TPA: cupin domain-containing protein [Bacteroidia bacterium]|jgi:mannose-6-phosphate isomerase-like protein (cupin superfamily)|nr:cupin domain-containing protein [Bacteroidia bacterium]